VTEIVVDASVTLSWCFPDEQTPMALEVLDRLKAGDSVVVPEFWSLEILNSLLIGERRGRISADQTKEFIENLLQLQPHLDHTTLQQVTGPVQRLCRDHQLTPYDTLYLELAMRRQCPLASLDQAQLGAAKALGIECL
jgi:predicted nucleic acid-binding protein